VKKIAAADIVKKECQFEEFLAATRTCLKNQSSALESVTAGRCPKPNCDKKGITGK